MFIAQDHPVTTSSAQLCEECRQVEAREPRERRLAEWAHLDITSQHPPDSAPEQGLVLVALPHTTSSTICKVELWLDGKPVGSATLTACTPCRAATLDYVHVTADHRRLGYGRVLVAATHARAPAFTWTAPLPESGAGASFRARIPFPKAITPCVHRREEADR
ncbi:GNAT family N-acetyltransferase [Amycolatopsis sp. NPDC051758]|uniref:GNAT family N-acetyltransferase n=1 Tax=Amycolatopsis sp. NPDC051758 TaxID=3363935 RepID=UPI0037BB5D24